MVKSGTHPCSEMRGKAQASARIGTHLPTSILALEGARHGSKKAFSLLVEQGDLHLHFAPGPTNDRAGTEEESDLEKKGAAERTAQSSWTWRSPVPGGQAGRDSPEAPSARTQECRKEQELVRDGCDR